MGRSLYYCALATLLLAGCETTSHNSQNKGVAPPIPTPSPYGPGQAPPPGAMVIPPAGAPPGTAPNNIPLPPGSPPTGMAPMVAPNSPEQARVNATATRLYQANPWLTARPQWIVTPADTPGITAQGEQTALIAAGLVHSSSDGQLAAVMSMHLGNTMAFRQQQAANAARNRKETSPPPDYYQVPNGSNSVEATLNANELAKIRSDPQDLRRKEERGPQYDAPTYARQILGQAGFSQLELDQAAPLLQRYPLICPR